MNEYSGAQVLVTGAGGFIGSHLCERLLQLGATVIGVDNFLSGSPTNIQHLLSYASFHFIEADAISSPHEYLPTLPSDVYLGLSLDFIFHLASPASPVTYQEYPIETYLVNSLGTHHLLQFILEQRGATRFLFASTSEIYGDPKEHPQKESYWGNVNPNGPRSMYDEAKRMGEAICGVHARDFDLDVRIVRIFNTYGPRMDISDGRVIPDFIRHLLTDSPLVVHGDGLQTRSFCYVIDLVDGLIAMMMSDKAKHQTVNLGNPHEITMLDLVNELATVAGRNPTLRFVEARTDDPHRRCPDITLAKKLLHWEPKVTLTDGLQKTYEYFTLHNSTLTDSTNGASE